ncbi:hypothetical protein LUZ60_015468 [Juncus effusus]|nr:hypothetical protein LUZ60_015468 [Juncus effusus]
MEKGSTSNNRSQSSSSMETDADSEWIPYFHKRRRIREEACKRSMEASLNEALKEQLTCSICLNYMTSPIFQCINGHTLCSHCNSALNKCPTCRETLVGARTRALEKIATSLSLPCMYARNGCNEKIPNFFIEEHESQCKFRPYKCVHAVLGCDFVGDSDSLLEHIREDHDHIMINDHFFTLRYPLDKLEEYSGTVPVVKTLGNHFFIHVGEFYKEGERHVRIYMDFLGDEDEANNYSYEIKTRSQKRNSFHVFGGTPQSVRQKRDFKENFDVFEISLKKALWYSKPYKYDDPELTLKFRIYENN